MMPERVCVSCLASRAQPPWMSVAWKIRKMMMETLNKRFEETWTLTREEVLTVIVQMYVWTEITAYLKKKMFVKHLCTPSRKAVTFQLHHSPTDLNIERGNLLIKDYLPTKFKASGAKCSCIISCTMYGDQHDLWPWPLTYWPEYQKVSSTHQGLSTYQVWSFWCKALLCYRLHKLWIETDWTTDGPTDIPIDMCKSICLSFCEGVGGINISWSST